MSSLYNQDTGRSTFVLNLISLVLVIGPLCFGGLAPPYLLTSLPAPGKPGRQEMAKKVARRLCYSWASLRLNSTTFCYISIPVSCCWWFDFSSSRYSFGAISQLCSQHARPELEQS